MLTIPLRLSSKHVAAARAVLRPWVKRGALRCTEVLEVPALACRARSIGRMSAHAVLVIGGLAVRQDALLIDRQPEAVSECRHRHRQPLDLRGRRRLAPEVVRRRIDAAEEGDADAPAVAPIGRGKYIIEYAVPDDVDAAVRIDLHMVVREELPVVPRRPVQVELSLLLVTWDICQ